MILSIEPTRPGVLQIACGAGNRFLQRVEQAFGVRFFGPPGDWRIEGARAEAAADAMRALIDRAERGEPLDEIEVESVIKTFREPLEAEESAKEVVLRAGRKRIRGKTPMQRRYLEALVRSELTIAVGPAGSGKTYLAVAAGVAALQTHAVERLVLTRPAVEAGERLGFLPGDLQQKIDPYLRPLFDALADMLGVQKMQALIEAGRIEIAPLAYMRGRTLSDAFIILDEAQNTTREQMKMFLTRLGFGSRMAVAGDVTQIDLENHRASGLLHVLKVLDGVEGVSIVRLGRADVVRHPLVERIVEAYDRDLEE